MADSRRVHVVPDGQDWKVRSEGAKRSAGNFENKSDAVERGREVAKNKDGQLLIHDKHGKVQEERTYRKDPYPPPG